MAATQPTLNELKSMGDPHIQYEIDEFRGSFDALKNLDRGRAEWNRTLESLLLHFRTLRGFFFGEGNQDGDIHASHYLAKWPHSYSQWNNNPDIFSRSKGDIDKRLAHLTTARLNPHSWTELNEMRAAMEALIDEFQSSLSADQAAWFPHLHGRANFVDTHSSASTATTRVLGDILG